MSTKVLSLRIDAEQPLSVLKAAREVLEKSQGELLLDFSEVQRIDAEGLKVLQELTDAAEREAVKLVLRGVNVQLYKVLKLVNLATRVSFAHEN